MSRPSDSTPCPVVRRRVTPRRAARAAALAAALPLLATPLLAQHEGHPPAAAPEQAAPVPLYGGLGGAHRAITTASPEAQQYFDQGLRWMHAFNLEEAEAAFREALRRDPSCATCAWGVAFALGPHINLPALPERTVAAARAAEQARTLAEAGAGAATDVERALIAAVARRYSDPAPATPEAQAALDLAYAEAMRDVARRFPEDAEVGFLLAESLMDLHPWDLYAPLDGTPREWTAEIVSTIERGLALDPRHPGLHHLYIHAVEASNAPERAAASADFLRRAMPDAAHVVHMPAHIDLRLGRYADAARANERAIAVDGSYLGKASPNVAFYKMIYAPHNLDFLATAAGMEGRGAATLLAMRALESHLDPAMLREMPGFDFLLGRIAWTLLRFGRHAEVLAEPLPPADFPYAQAAAHAARGLALLRLGRADEAEAEAAAMRAASAAIPEGAAEGLNTAAALVRIPAGLLEGELAIARGEVDDGVAKLAAAVAAEDELRYNEPSDWHFPSRHLAGPALLRVGRNAEAEALFRADLARHPGNGWALAGLVAALERQGKEQDAAALRPDLERAWAAADLGLERLAAPPGAALPTAAPSG